MAQRPVVLDEHCVYASDLVLTLGEMVLKADAPAVRGACAKLYLTFVPAIGVSIFLLLLIASESLAARPSYYTGGIALRIVRVKNCPGNFLHMQQIH